MQNEILKNWLKPLLIVSPFAIDYLFHQSHFLTNYPYGLVFTVETIVQVVTITFTYFIPFAIGLRFLKEAGLKGHIYKINGAIPLLFWTVATVWAFIHIPDYLNIYPRKYIEDGNTLEKIIFILLFHSFITYFFLNTRIIKFLIEKKTTIDRREHFRAKYLNAMKRYRNTSAGLILLLLCTIILPIIIKNIHIKLI